MLDFAVKLKSKSYFLYNLAIVICIPVLLTIIFLFIQVLSNIFGFNGVIEISALQFLKISYDIIFTPFIPLSIGIDDGNIINRIGIVYVLINDCAKIVIVMILGISIVRDIRKIFNILKKKKDGDYMYSCNLKNDEKVEEKKSVSYEEQDENIKYPGYERKEEYKTIKHSKENSETNR